MTDSLDWLPEPFRPFVEAAIAVTQADLRILGLTLGGSAVTGIMDAYSDLDFVVVTDDEHHRAVLSEAPSLAARLGPLLAAFTGEHVRDPRLLLCLYGPPLLRVDLKFVTERELDSRVEDGRILWQRNGTLDDAFRRTPAAWPRVDPQWIEDRFWIWLHNGTTKAGRGEFLACVEQLAFLRRTVIGPLIAQQRGHHPDGVRRLELIAPDLAPSLAKTIGDDTAIGCLHALRATADLYLRLREEAPLRAQGSGAETATLAYLTEITHRLGNMEQSAPNDVAD